MLMAFGLGTVKILVFERLVGGQSVDDPENTFLDHVGGGGCMNLSEQEANVRRRANAQKVAHSLWVVSEGGEHDSVDSVGVVAPQLEFLGQQVQRGKEGFIAGDSQSKLDVVAQFAQRFQRNDQSGIGGVVAVVGNDFIHRIAVASQFSFGYTRPFVGFDRPRLQNRLVCVFHKHHAVLLARLHELGELLSLVGVLDTHRHSDQVVVHSVGLSFGAGNAAVGHHCGHLDQRLDTAEGFRQREQVSGGRENRGGFGSALDAERNHASSEPVAVALQHHVVALVALQAGVVDGEDVGVADQVLGDFACGKSSASDSQVQRLQASVGQPRVERRGNGPNGVAQEPEPVVQLVAVDGQNAHHHVRVSVDVLGDRVDHNVCAVVQRVGDVGRQEGVVDHQKHLVAGSGLVVLQELRDTSDVGHLQRRVRGGFQPHQPGVVLEGARETGGQVRHKLRGDAVRVGDFGEISVGSAVNVTAGNDVRVDRQRAHDQRGGSRARSQGDGVLGVLQSGHSDFKVVSVGVGGPRVLVNSYGLGGLGASKRGGQRERLDDGPGVGVDGGASMDGFGAESVVGRLFDSHEVGRQNEQIS